MKNAINWNVMSIIGVISASTIVGLALLIRMEPTLRDQALTLPATQLRAGTSR